MLNLILETLESCEDYIPRLVEAALNISNCLQSGDEAAGVQLFHPMFEGLNWLAEAVDALQKHNYLQDIHVSELNQVLKPLEEALEVRDYVQIADIFEYELVPLLESWHDKVRALYAQLKVM